MKRREFLAGTGLVAVGLSGFPLGWAAAGQRKPRKVLYFTRSAGFQHSVVARKDGELSHSEKIMIEVGKQHDVEVVCTKDGRVFDGDLDSYDCFAFYTSGDLTKPIADEKRNAAEPPMSPEGYKRLLDAVAAGKGFVGFHAASDSFHSRGNELSPYVAMLGGEFITHGRQQEATMKVVSPKFPGAEKLGDSFRMVEEWYALKNFAKDLHVILVQETEGMQDACYQRPPFPATWARLHGQGRVFYTSLGHREDVWTNPLFQDLCLGGFAWAMKEVDADVTPNIDQVTPKANQLSY